MGGPGRDHNHPAIGRYAVCRDGKIGLIQVAMKRTDGGFMFMGTRIVDDTKWQSRKPVFLNIEETAVLSGTDRALREGAA